MLDRTVEIGIILPPMIGYADLDDMLDVAKGSREDDTKAVYAMVVTMIHEHESRTPGFHAHGQADHAIMVAWVGDNHYVHYCRMRVGSENVMSDRPVFGMSGETKREALFLMLKAHLKQRGIAVIQAMVTYPENYMLFDGTSKYLESLTWHNGEWVPRIPE